MLDQLRSAELATIRQPPPATAAAPSKSRSTRPTGPQRAARAAGAARAALAEAIGELPERERQILALYYDEELTLAEIGEVIGVGESRVSQLRTQAIARLRALLGAALRQKGRQLTMADSRGESTRCSRPRRRAVRATARRARVVRYNFRRPDRVSKEQIRSLQFLHERFARNVATSLSAYLRTLDRAVGGLGGAVHLRRVPARR